MSRPDALEQELYETVADKQAFQVKLRQLRSEVRLVEASLEALQQKESWLTHELAKRTRVRTELPSIDDFVQGRALESAIPKFFDLDQEPKEPKEPEELRSDEDENENAEESQSQKAESDDWEEMLESLGVARRVRWRKGGLVRLLRTAPSTRRGACEFRFRLAPMTSSLALPPASRDRSPQSSSTRNAALAPGRTVQPAEAKSNEQE
ncbi:unnamed protein product [Symbiodinium sp. CCMP2592]|nr:unnamed protein product [Symbiodinium sp. CCMP2592]